MTGKLSEDIRQEILDLARSFVQSVEAEISGQGR